MIFGWVYSNGRIEWCRRAAESLLRLCNGHRTLSSPRSHGSTVALIIRCNWHISDSVNADRMSTVFDAFEIIFSRSINFGPIMPSAPYGVTNALSCTLGSRSMPSIRNVCSNIVLSIRTLIVFAVASSTLRTNSMSSGKLFGNSGCVSLPR